MKRIDKAELYQNLSGFLKSKGIELTDGDYASGVKKSCSFLADAINLSQMGIERARTEVEKQFDNLRQVIHESTAPRKTAAPKAGSTSKSKSAPSGSKKADKRKAAKRSGRSNR